jgi:hypothetical protein
VLERLPPFGGGGQDEVPGTGCPSLALRATLAASSGSGAALGRLRRSRSRREPPSPAPGGLGRGLRGGRTAAGVSLAESGGWLRVRGAGGCVDAGAGGSIDVDTGASGCVDALATDVDSASTTDTGADALGAGADTGSDAGSCVATDSGTACSTGDGGVDEGRVGSGGLDEIVRRAGSLGTRANAVCSIATDAADKGCVGSGGLDGIVRRGGSLGGGGSLGTRANAVCWVGAGGKGEGGGSSGDLNAIVRRGGALEEARAVGGLGCGGAAGSGGGVAAAPPCAAPVLMAMPISVGARRGSRRTCTPTCAGPDDTAGESSWVGPPVADGDGGGEELMRAVSAGAGRFDSCSSLARAITRSIASRLPSSSFTKRMPRPAAPRRSPWGRSHTTRPIPPKFPPGSSLVHLKRSSTPGGDDSAVMTNIPNWVRSRQSPQRGSVSVGARKAVTSMTLIRGSRRVSLTCNLRSEARPTAVDLGECPTSEQAGWPQGQAGLLTDLARASVRLAPRARVGAPRRPATAASSQCPADRGNQSRLRRNSRPR